MLHAEDITVGDWCRRRSIYQDTGREVVTDFQITQICKNGENLYVYGPKGNMGRVDQIEPIPLTPEILEKNGFKVHEQDFTSNTVYEFGGLGYIEFEGFYKYFDIGSEITYRSFGREITYIHSLMRIYFVHELQHALRLCGIEKEIEL